MENVKQQSQSTEKRSMGLSPRKIESEQALHSDSAPFYILVNHDVTTNARGINTAASAAESNAWVSTLDELTQSSKHADISKDRTNNIPTRKKCSIITISREELRSIFQVKVKSVVVAAQWAKARIMSENRVEETIFNVFSIGRCAAIDGFKNMSFSFVESSIMKTISRGALNEARCQNFTCWSRSSASMQAFV